MRWKKSPCRTREEVLVIAFDPSWAEPDASLLEDRRGELPEFPIEVLPPGLSNWLLRASRGRSRIFVARPWRGPLMPIKPAI